MYKKAFLLLGVTMLFALVALVPVMAQTDATLPNTVNIGSNETLGDFLVGANGMTLYVFKHDGLAVSNCIERCAENWPPLTVASADELSLADGIPGELATIEGADGALHVTYNDQPLYFWVNDVEPGDATGHNSR
ncbi:MAG: hypothetical protein H7Y11_15490, partial [Armatimonadetes bacterium]|nr:hypothetical protein [Anaerolineae bacterium]